MLIQTPTPEPIAVIEVLLQRNTMLEVLVLVLPVITFILGFLLSFIKDDIYRNREINNIKKVLFNELADNQIYLYAILDSLERLSDWTPHDIIESFQIDEEIRKLSTSVYDAYLDKLHLLSSREIQRIMTVYNHIIRSNKVAIDFNSDKKRKASIEHFRLLYEIYVLIAYIESDIHNALTQLKIEKELVEVLHRPELTQGKLLEIRRYLSEQLKIEKPKYI